MVPGLRMCRMLENSRLIFLRSSVVFLRFIGDLFHRLCLSGLMQYNVINWSAMHLSVKYRLDCHLQLKFPAKLSDFTLI